MIKHKKSLGQNFLQDEQIKLQILNVADLDNDTTVIEIGPGIGDLTSYMLPQCSKIIAIELDDRLIPILEKKFGDKNFELIHKDILKVDFSELNITTSKVKVVANLPYYITSAIITKILKEFDSVSDIVIMVQKEVGQRLAAEHNSKKYGSLSVYVQTLCDVEYEFTVPSHCFDPAPKVDSAIISMRKKEGVAVDSDYEQFIQNCFKQKRKTLSNNLKASYEMTGEELNSLLEFPTIRAEQISIDDFKLLYNKFLEMNK